MKITKRQLGRIIKEERRKLHEVQDDEMASVVSDAILELFFADGEVRTTDVHDYLRTSGYGEEDINLGLENLAEKY